MRRDSDYYPTPAWCVYRLLDVMDIRGRVLCDPCAGDGAIVKAARMHGAGCRWTVMDIRPECEEQLTALGGTDVTIGNALEMPHPGCPIITNPPYSLAFEFAQWAVQGSHTVAMLMRLNWLASSKRSGWLREHTPTVCVLPQRPSFTGHGADSIDYAWMVWDRAPLIEPTVVILDDTPLSERRS